MLLKAPLHTARLSFLQRVSDDITQQVKSFSGLQETDLKLDESHFLSLGHKFYLYCMHAHLSGMRVCVPV